MAKQSVQFDNSDGETLTGEIYWPAGKVRAMVLFAHCFTCSKNVKAAVGIARTLNRLGFAVMTFDFTGLGASEGQFADTNFSSNVSDLIEAAAFLEQRFRAPDILVGHSLGGTAVLAAAGQLPSCKAAATIGSPARAGHVAKLLSDKREEIDARGEATVDIGGRPFRIKQQFLEDIEHDTVAMRLSELRLPLLIMHSPRDTIVSIDNAGEIFQRAIHPKSFVSLDDADHLLSRNADASYAAQVLAAWASRFLDEATVEVDGVLARTRAGELTTALQAGPHEWLADEPAAVGGAELGPSPYDLLSAALASCTSMTLQLYARRKGFELDEARVRVRHARIHAEDCADCETKGGRIDEFRREVQLLGKLDAATRERLLEIADRCPVHRSLTNETRIVTTLAAALE
jgi:putative redox protein